MSDVSDAESDTEKKEQKIIEDCSDPANVTKYTKAAEILNSVMQKASKLMKPGVTLLHICTFCDTEIEKQLQPIFSKFTRGISFPTCVSLNNICGHFCPLANDKTVLAAGDVAKLDMGSHIDGYVAITSYTFVIPDVKEGEEGKDTEVPDIETPIITGPKANVILAAHTAAEAAYKMMKIGNKNTDVTRIINKVADEFHVNLVYGVMSHELKRNKFDAEKIIISKIDPRDTESKIETCEFEAYEVYAIDIVMTTGEGKPREIGDRTTVYKRVPEASYKLNLQAARKVFSQVLSKHPVFPFTIRNFDDNRARFGLTECTSHGLLTPYPVLHEKAGEYVAQFKYTVLLLPSRTINITEIPFDTTKFQSEFSLKDPELIEILARSTSSKKKKKIKKKK